MTLDPYTYVTLSVHGDEKPQMHVSFHTPEISVNLLTVEDVRPVLHLSTREADVMISTTGAGPVTDHDVTLAREIFNAAAQYLADCERLYSGQSATGKATDQTAA
ncbi:hypothetical protein ABZ297_44620 [Nonomuraea sp. NPDC005983]|uniref:hypothetical protein n=1 Tax=unclassified Nonomuraea TaxID=2593643 RepID=UPI00331BB096